MEITTTEELQKMLTQLYADNEDEILAENYRYVIYARKSTTSEDRQERSLGDQIAECRGFAKRLNLKVLSEPIQESESAKEPDIRPKFRQMLENIKKGKFEGILSWSPDRLARNMKEAGEIIDLVDKGIIKDLKFINFTFENNATGKTMLGMQFVLSKQYSDNLSINVRRGLYRTVNEGKYPSKAKHGYIKDINQFLQPDGSNFVLIKEAWKMRLQKRTYEEISKYLKDSNYTRRDSKTEQYEPFLFSNQRLTDLFSDPTYAGVLPYGQAKRSYIDLTKEYNFVPMISVKEFMTINKIDSFTNYLKSQIRAQKDDNSKLKFLNEIVICGYCGERRQRQLTPKTLKDGTKIKYYSFRCDNPDCKFQGKSTRATVITDFVYEYLYQYKITSREAYKHYLEEMKRINLSARKRLDSQKASFTTSKGLLEKKLKRTKDGRDTSNDISVRNSYELDIKQILLNIEANKEALQLIDKEIQKHKDFILTYEKFLELFGNMATTLQNMEYVNQKDELIRKIFLNFTAGHKEVLDFKLNVPFDRFLKSQEFMNIMKNRDDRT